MPAFLSPQSQHTFLTINPGKRSVVSSLSFFHNIGCLYILHVALLENRGGQTVQRFIAQQVAEGSRELATPENIKTYHNALCLSPQILHKHSLKFLLGQRQRLCKILATPESIKTYHNALCLSPQILHRHCFQFLLGPF